MRRRIQQLQQLLRDSQYVVDERLIATAIIARATARGLVPEIEFRNDLRAPRVQSFRPTRHARSFRPCVGSKAADGLGLLVPSRRT
jgi:type IV secretory pathway VirD2 relaxase